MSNSKIVYSVSDLTYQIKNLLEESFPSLWVEGEVSNYKKHYSGHYYFTLKDQSAQISCVMWKSRTHSIPFEFEDGMQVHIFGNLRLYEKSGRYQMDCIIIQQAGIGDLQLKYEQLKKELYEEGLFDEEHKKQIPIFPNKIGIITSPTGAAIKDILAVIKRRYPISELVIGRVKVQGEGASQEIVTTLEQMNKYDDIDLIILGRGGGSLEDLWAFNEENVARAIYASNMPVISAVGHEIDYTIADFVSDLRAPTPSAAAELAVPDISEIKPKILNLYQSLQLTFNNFLNNSRNNISNYLTSYSFRKPTDIIRQYSQKIDDLIPQLVSAYSNRINIKKIAIDNLKTRLETLQPDNVMRRGYAIIQKDKEIIKTVNSIEINDSIDIKFFDGKIKSTVSEKKS